MGKLLSYVYPTLGYECRPLAVMRRPTKKLSKFGTRLILLQIASDRQGLSGEATVLTIALSPVRRAENLELVLSRRGIGRDEGYLSFSMWH